MKHISEIYLQGLKGVTGTFKLSPITVIVGDNERGKSAILDGITINLLGYHPRHGKTAAATMELASADRMDSAVKFSDGNLRAGIWERNAKGTCKATIAPPIIDDYAVDLRSFQSLKNQDKLALLFSRCDSTEEPWRQFKESILTGNAETDALINKSYGLSIMPVPHRIASTVENLNTARNNARAAAKSATNALQSWDASNSATSVGPLISAEEFAKLEEEYQIAKNQASTDCVKQEVALQEVTKAKYAVREVFAKVEACKQAITKLADSAITMPEEVNWSSNDDKLLSTATKTLGAKSGLLTTLVDQLKNLEDLQQSINTSDGKFECPTCFHIHSATKKAIEIEQLRAEVVVSIKEARADESALKTTVNTLSKRRTAAGAYQQSARLLDSQTAGLKAAQNILDSEEQLFKKCKTYLADQESNLANAVAALDASRATVGTLEGRYGAHKEHRDRTSRVEIQSKVRQEKVAEADRATRIADTLSEVCKVATARMTELVDGAVRKLFTIGNHIWASVNDDSMICIEDGAIGFRRKGWFYTWECMSGRQELIATIGLQVALASGEGRGIVLIDEFGRLDSPSASKVLVCLEHLIKSGDLAQVIIATPVPIMGVPKSATIITL